MSTEKKETEIIYRLIDEVSQDIKKLQQSVDDANKSAENSQGFDSLTSKIVKANVATVALVKAFDLVKQGVGVFNDILLAGAKLDMSNETIERLGQNLGYTTTQLEKYRDTLETANVFGSQQNSVIQAFMQTGLMPLIEATKFLNGEEGLKGFSITVKDLSAAMQISSSQGFQLVTNALVKLNDESLRQLGIEVNLLQKYQQKADALGKTAMELTEVEKRQVILNTIVQEGSKFMGVYADTYDTAGKNILSLTDVTANLREELGTQLQPAYKVATNTLLSFVKGVRDFVKENPNFVQNLVIGAAAIAGVVTAFVAASKIMAITTGAITLLKGAFAALSVQITATQLATGLLGIALVALGALAAKAYAEQVNEQQKVADESDNTKGALQDMFGSAVEGSNALGEGLNDNMMKIAQLRQQIERENESFNKQLSQIVDARRASIEENQKLLDQEQKAFAQKEKDRQKKYQDTTKKISDENEQRLRDLEDTLGQELQVGSSNYDERLAAYLAAVDAERVAGEQRLAEAKAEYDEETQTVQSEYDERTSALQAKISADEALLAKHAELIKTINRDVLRDEIEELQANHQRRLEEINNQITKERSAWKEHTAGMGADFAKLYEGMNDQVFDINSTLKPIDWKRLVGDVGNDLVKYAKMALGGLAGAIVEIARNIAIWLRGVIESIPLVGGEIAKHLNNEQQINALASQMFADIENWSGIGANARGTKYWKGGATRINEQGGEIVDLPQGTRIYPADKSEEMMKKNGGNITIVNNYPEGLPAELVVSRQMFQIKTLTA